jgi:hypothetical protein
MKRLDLTGKSFGLLTVVGLHSSDGRHVKWNCVCACGNESVVITTNLRSGHTTKCRTHQRIPLEMQKKEHALYQTWKEMHRRCYDEKSTSFERYGERGISVCSEWADFWQFVQDMGAKPHESYQLDRKDSNGPYCPSNCRWVTPGENSRNRDFVKLNDQTAATVKTLLQSGIERIEIAKRFSVSVSCIDDIARQRTWKHVSPNPSLNQPGA